MANEMPTLEAEKEEVPTFEGAERTRERRAFVPRADIFETADAIVVLADMPGVDGDAVEITLEKNVLTINAYVDEPTADGFEIAYAEYEAGEIAYAEYVSDQIDQGGIEASIHDGVLRLVLPKAEPVKARKIAVKSA